MPLSIGSGGVIHGRTGSRDRGHGDARRARRLVSDGFPVRVLSRSPEKATAALGAGFEVVRGDVEDVASLKTAMDGCGRLRDWKGDLT
ncbi:MAG: NAD(P)H-binding protein [Acidobacteriota bacterium]